MKADAKLPNIGPRTAAWLRQVGLHTPEALAQAGAVGAYVRIRRAGFRAGLNLLYSLEGALRGVHWQDVPEARRRELVAQAQAAIADLPAPRDRPPAGAVRLVDRDDL